jgi:nucleoside-diphosphate-sugar epimerase
MSTIAITGASGFVGRALHSRLDSLGIPSVLVSRSPLWVNRGSLARYCDAKGYSDISLLARYFSGCDFVVHLAARAHVRDASSNHPALQLFRKANVESLVAVAKASKIAGVRRLVFLSSIGVNGTATYGTPFTEADTPCPTDPYAITKLEAEKALSAELSSSSTDWVVLRPPLVYGPSCPGNLQRLLCLASSAPILPFGSLHARRTLISVDNLIDALMVATWHPALSRQVFVVSDAQDIDVAGMLRAILLGLRRGSWRLLPVPPFLIGFLSLLLGKRVLWKKFSGELRVDSSAFQRATGWIPQVCPSDGLRHAAALLR